MHSLTYMRGVAEPAAINAEAHKIWVSVLSSDELNAVLADAGLSADDIGTDFPFSVSEGSAGLVVSGTTIVVGILSPVAKDILVDLWRKILLPRLQRRFGGDFIGKEIEDTKK